MVLAVGAEQVHVGAGWLGENRVDVFELVAKFGEEVFGIEGEGWGNQPALERVEPFAALVAVAQMLVHRVAVSEAVGVEEVVLGEQQQVGSGAASDTHTRTPMRSASRPTVASAAFIRYLAVRTEQPSASATWA
jgi:hypothetical protein